MSSIINKVEYLKETKSMFKQWIIDQQGIVTDTTPFRDYVDIIDAILTRGPIIPDTWIDLTQISSSKKGGLKLKWSEYGAENGEYVWCSNDMSSLATPDNTSRWNSICTLTLPYGKVKLGLGRWGTKVGLKWILYSSGDHIIGSTDVDEDYTVSGSGRDWSVTISNYLNIPTSLGEYIIEASGDSVVPNDILVTEYRG